MLTHMNERLGIAPHIVEAVANHLSGPAKAGVAGVYNRALYMVERRRALAERETEPCDVSTCRTCGAC